MGLACLMAVLCVAQAAEKPLPKGVIMGTGHTVGYGELKVGLSEDSRDKISSPAALCS